MPNLTPEDQKKLDDFVKSVSPQQREGLKKALDKMESKYFPSGD